MVCNFSCKIDLAALARGAALVIDLYFFNIQSEWIAPVVITHEWIYRWARWAGDNNLSAKRVDPEKELIQCLVLFGFSNYDHWIE